MGQFIAAYDISRNKARSSVATVLLTYGVRIQESVFQIELEADEINDLKRQVGAWLDKDDRFDLLPLDLRKHRPRLAWQQVPESLTAVVSV